MVWLGSGWLWSNWLGSSWLGRKRKRGLDGWVGFGRAIRRRGLKVRARLWSEQFADGNELRGQVAALKKNREAGIEGLVDGDGSVGVAEPIGAGQYLEDDLSESDGVVFEDDAVMLKAEDRVEFGSTATRAVSRFGALREIGRASCRERVCVPV